MGAFRIVRDAPGPYPREGYPPPPSIFGIFTLARNPRQNLDVKELRSQNLDSKGLLLVALTGDAHGLVFAVTIFSETKFRYKVGCHTRFRHLLPRWLAKRGRTHGLRPFDRLRAE